MRFAAIAVVVCLGCGGGEGSLDEEDVVSSGSAHALPVGFEAPARTGKLRWYGGPVLARAKVVAVQWGSASEPVADFYKTFVASAAYRWLSEYDTSSQSIAAGSFAGAVRISPVKARGTSLTDAQVERELAAQIAAGVLPVPDANTVFMVHFPAGVRISLGSSHSCEAGGFCGYHSAFKLRGKRVAYAVLPDMGGGCTTGCGSGTAFERLTSVASHELVEAVTDPEVGLATGLGPPLAWYDSAGGEIGDLCAGQTTRAGSYVVQKEWSNSAGRCR